MIEEQIYNALTTTLTNRAKVINGYPNNLQTADLPCVAFRLSSRRTTLQTLTRTNNAPNHIHYSTTYRVDLFSADSTLTDEIEDTMLGLGFETTLFTKLIDKENPLIKHYVWDFTVPTYKIKRS